MAGLPDAMQEHIKKWGMAAGSLFNPTRLSGRRGVV